jgi:hypothetical protein
VLLCVFPIKFIPETEVDPTDDTSLLLLLLSLIEAVIVAAPFGNDDDRFEDDDDIFFATIATSATMAHEATTIMAIFLDVLAESTGVITLPVLLAAAAMASSDATVVLVIVVSLTAGLDVGAETGDSVNDGETVNDGGIDTVGTAVGFRNMGLGVLRGNGKLIDKLSDISSPSRPRKLLELSSNKWLREV